jgi:peptidoglycan/xylan/chitin deacetylase (PgdA/CDA1 family)
MRSLVKSAVFRASIFIHRRFDRGRATLLNYHRFPAEQADGFRRQCEYLSKHCGVISMSDLTACLREGRPLPAHAVVITVDDGHRDFYTCAYPILRDFGLTAVMYLPTAFLDGAWLWFDRYQYIFDRSPLERAECSLLDSLGQVSLDLSSRSARYREFLEIAREAQWLPAGERDGLGDRLAEALQVSVPESPPEEFAPLRWDAVREMSNNGIEFGGHTVTHPILQTLSSSENLTQEIAGCKKRIQEELQAPVRHFAYPSGKAEEIPSLAKEAVAQAGFETAVTTLPGQAQPGDDPLWLRRIGVDPGVDSLWFRRCAAAVRVGSA